MWMSYAEQSEAQLRQETLAKLSAAPASAAKTSGPRSESDLSYLIWQSIKQKVGIDFEKPVPLSQWRQMRNFDKEFMPLAACTDTELQDQLLLNDKKLRQKNRYSDILAYKHSRVQLVARESL